MFSSCTAVRIPTLRAHSEAITIETEKPVTTAAARKVNVEQIEILESSAVPVSYKYTACVFYRFWRCCASHLLAPGA